MTQFIKQNKGIISFAILFLLLAILYPIHFISDDWEELESYYSGIKRLHHDGFMNRFPVAVTLLKSTFFVIFIHGSLCLGKLIFWSFQIAAYGTILSIFIDRFWSKLKTQPIYALVLLFISFGPNNYEWNLWPTNMTLFPILLLIALSFKLYTLNQKSPLFIIIKTITYIAAFLTSESLIPMFILLECSYRVYKVKEKWPQRIAILAYNIIPPLIIIFIIKKFFLTVSVNISNLGFKPHLFRQFLSLTFLHDYYKTLFSTGILSLLAISSLIIYRIKNDLKTFISQDLFIFILYLIGSSYFYYVMDYSSRRALAGPLYFFWGWITISFIFWNIKSSHWTRKLSTALFVTAFLIHTAYVARAKYIDANALEANAFNIRKKLKADTKVPIAISPNELRKGMFKRGWNLVNNTQYNGFLRYYLIQEELEQIKLFPMPNRN